MLSRAGAQTSFNLLLITVFPRHKSYPYSSKTSDSRGSWRLRPPPGPDTGVLLPPPRPLPPCYRRPSPTACIPTQVRAGVFLKCTQNGYTASSFCFRSTCELGCTSHNMKPPTCKCLLRWFLPHSLRLAAVSCVSFQTARSPHRARSPQTSQRSVPWACPLHFPASRAQHCAARELRSEPVFSD